MDRREHGELEKEWSHHRLAHQPPRVLVGRDTTGRDPEPGTQRNVLLNNSLTVTLINIKMKEIRGQSNKKSCDMLLTMTLLSALRVEAAGDPGGGGKRSRG